MEFNALMIIIRIILLDNFVNNQKYIYKIIVIEVSLHKIKYLVKVDVLK